MNYEKLCERINLSALITPEEAGVIRAYDIACESRNKVVEIYGSNIRKVAHRPSRVAGLEVVEMGGRPRTSDELWAETKAGQKLASEKARAGELIAAGKIEEGAKIASEAEAEFSAVKHILEAADTGRMAAGLRLDAVVTSLRDKINAALEAAADELRAEMSASLLAVSDAWGMPPHNAAALAEHFVGILRDQRVSVNWPDYVPNLHGGDPGAHWLRQIIHFRPFVLAAAAQISADSVEPKAKGKKLSGAGATGS